MNQSIEDAAQQLAVVAGVSVVEATNGIEKALQGLRTPTLDAVIAVNQWLATAEDCRRQERWATDPMGLMEWLTLDQWRWAAVDALGAMQDALARLADWIEPE